MASLKLSYCQATIVIYPKNLDEKISKTRMKKSRKSGEFRAVRSEEPRRDVAMESLEDGGSHAGRHGSRSMLKRAHNWSVPASSTGEGAGGGPDAEGSPRPRPIHSARTSPLRSPQRGAYALLHRAPGEPPPNHFVP